jgi:hypothetical protein
LPVIDQLAAEYSERVAFVAPAWKGSLEDTTERAAELLPSGEVMWGLDADESIFAAYGIPYQPAVVLIGSDGAVKEEWLGVRSEEEMRSSLQSLLASG